MSLLLALQGAPDITGSGASSFGFTDAGTALEVFEGSGAAAFGFTDAGVALEIFTGSGAPSFGFTDGGDALEIFIGTGSPNVAFFDDGVGTVEGGVQPDAPANGGGWTFRDRDRTFRKTVKSFDRLLHPDEPQRSKRPAAEKQQHVFAYVSESAFSFVGAGRGETSLVRGAGSSRARIECRGQGRIEESAADIIRLLLSIDEI